MLSVCLDVCLDVNQGGTNINRCCTQRLVILHAQYLFCFCLIAFYCT